MYRNTALLMMFAAAAMTILLTAGCENFLKKEPPPPPEPQGPQTKEEVMAEIRPVIQPLLNAKTPGAPGVSDEQRNQIMTGLRNAIVAHGDKDFGKAALRDAAYEIIEVAKVASAAERYRLVLMCIDVVELLSVESQLLKRLGAKADVMMEKPVVHVKGFMEDHEKKEMYVFLDIINHKTGVSEQLEAREGDEFHNLRLVRVAGRNKGVIFEYLKVPGLFFEIEAF